MTTFKDMVDRFRENKAMQNAKKPYVPPVSVYPSTGKPLYNSHNADADAAAPAGDEDDSHTSVEKTSGSMPNMEHIRMLRMYQKRQEDEKKKNYNLTPQSRVIKILNHTFLRDDKGGIAAATKLSNKFSTAEAGIMFYKLKVWHLFEHYRFLGIPISAIVEYYDNGLTEDQIKANLDWQIDHPGEDIYKSKPILPTWMNKSTTLPYRYYHTPHDEPYKPKFIQPYKPPHKVERENLQSRWHSIKEKLQKKTTKQNQKRDHFGRLEDMSSLYEYHSDDEFNSSDSENSTFDYSNDENNVTDTANSIIRINADGTHSRMKFNRSGNDNSNSHVPKRTIFRATHKEPENLFGNLFGDEDEESTQPPTYQESQYQYYQMQKQKEKEKQMQKQKQPKKPKENIDYKRMWSDFIAISKFMDGSVGSKMDNYREFIKNNKHKYLIV